MKRINSIKLNFFLFLYSHSFSISTLSREKEWQEEETRCFDEFVTIIDDTSFRDFFKRTMNNVDLTRDDESTNRLKKFDVQVSISYDKSLKRNNTIK